MRFARLAESEQRIGTPDGSLEQLYFYGGERQREYQYQWDVYATLHEYMRQHPKLASLTIKFEV